MLRRAKEHSGENKQINNQPRIVKFPYMKVIRKRQAIAEGQTCSSRGYILLPPLSSGNIILYFTRPHHSPFLASHIRSFMSLSHAISKLTWWVQELGTCNGSCKLCWWHCFSLIAPTHQLTLVLCVWRHLGTDERVHFFKILVHTYHIRGIFSFDQSILLVVLNLRKWAFRNHRNFSSVTYLPLGFWQDEHLTSMLVASFRRHRAPKGQKYTSMSEISRRSQF